ncbi:PREDICTED: uncharacterized protein LOC106149569 [Chinchilla lanigera]|uniref:uncharacterized protein LOC106149569 n=1 Tax=Chinchilla lanigera TaxID=34839 RepID=UPI0006992519|nr:PREDICTED: uncharacterized protein LOC106149569 [Chinchilla lanigera]
MWLCAFMWGQGDNEQAKNPSLSCAYSATPLLVNTFSELRTALGRRSTAQRPESARPSCHSRDRRAGDSRAWSGGHPTQGTEGLLGGRPPGGSGDLGQRRKKGGAQQQGPDLSSAGRPFLGAPPGSPAGQRLGSHSLTRPQIYPAALHFLQIKAQVLGSPHPGCSLPPASKGRPRLIGGCHCGRSCQPLHVRSYRNQLCQGHAAGKSRSWGRNPGPQCQSPALVAPPASAPLGAKYVLRDGVPLPALCPPCRRGPRRVGGKVEEKGAQAPALHGRKRTQALAWPPALLLRLHVSRSGICTLKGGPSPDSCAFPRHS